MATFAELNKYYLAYFGRPVDYAGSREWADKTTAQVEAAFAASNESKALYASSSKYDFVNNVYKNVIGRPAELAGLNYWVDQIDSGKITQAGAAIAILKDALLTADKTSVENKLIAGEDFFNAIDTTAEVLAYQGAAAAASARAFIAGVTATPATAEQVKAALAAVGDASAGATGQTFTLTAGVENVQGTAGNDTISGVADGVTSTTVGAGQPVTQTFGGLDVLNGGAGTDTLTLSNDVGTMTLATSVTVGSIENLVLRSAQKDITADVQAWTGLDSITVDQRGAADNVRITTKGNATSVTIAAGASAAAHDSDGAGTADAADSVITITDNGTAATTADKLATVSVTGAQGAVNITSDAMANLTLADSAALATVTNTTVGHTLNVTANKQSGAAGVADAAATTVNVTASGANSTAFAVTAGAATTINYAGDKNLVSTLGAQAAALKINSTGTGTLTIGTTLNDDVTFTGGAGKETITITNNNSKAIAMGAGDDKVNVSGTTLGANGTIDGGDGTDTIAMSSADAAALTALAPATTYEARISNFEKVGLAAVLTGAADSVNLSNLDDISYVVSAGTAAANVVQAAVKEIQTITVGGAADANGGILTVGGVAIEIGNNASAATVAATIAAQQTALKAANANIESVVQGAGANADKVIVTYVNTAGDVNNIAIAQNVSGVTLGAVATPTAGAASSAEVQTITVGSAAAQSGSFTVGGVTVPVLVADSANTVAAKITTALNAALPAGVASVVNTGAPSGTVTITYNASVGNVNNMAFTGADAIFGSANVPTIAETTAGGTGGTKEVQTFTVTGADADGGQLVIGGVKVAVAGAATADQVGAAIIAKQADILAANSNIESIGYNTVGSVVTVTYKVTAGNVADLVISSNDTVGVTPTVAQTTAGAVFNGTAAGALTLVDMANAGTLELTGNNNGAITVTMKDATGTADSLNIKLNGAANLVGAADIVGGTVNAAGVETINITTTDSSVDTPTVQNSTAATVLNLNATSATTITISGNHGVDFTGSNLAKVTTLDASGVAGNVNTTGMTAAQIIAANGVAGAVTFTAQVTDKAVTITTGNGNDLINASLVGTATGSTVGATITTGAGVDTVTGSKNADVINTGSERDTVNSSGGGDTITLGAGNDKYVLVNAAHSVLAKSDTITDFSANTYGFGTSGAANNQGANLGDATKVTGDVIDLSISALTTIDVQVVTSAADALTFLNNNSTNTSNIGVALDSTSGKLYIDLNDDGTADSVITLTGVTTITEAAFLI
ncbi:S-layer protein RsaA [Thauera terpenica]